MDVLMPQLGETVAEGKIVKWFKSAGDAVKPGENLFEIETDKTSMEVPATSAGTLTDIRFQVGQVAKVGAVVAVIAGAAGATTGSATTSPPPIGERDRVREDKPLDRRVTPSPHPSPQRGEGVRAAAPQTSSRPQALLDPFREVRTPTRNFGPAKLPGGIAVTPLARRLAGERGIDLSRISGSGPRGRIIAADVDKVVPAVGGRAMPGASAAQVKALFEGVPYEEVPLDPMRATIARRLVEAKQTIPHFYLTADLDVGRLTAMREEANKAAPVDREGNPAYRFSLNDFIIKAWAAALMRTPAANAVWAEDRILRFAQADIGVAVALEGGLITPVLRHADGKSLTAISAEMRDLAARARDKKLKANEYRGGASAISNLGMYGVREFSAIINPPHATLLAVGAARRAPVETEDGGIRFISQMSVTLSCDHRVVDGALGAQLLAAFKSIVEMPVAALI